MRLASLGQAFVRCVAVLPVWSERRFTSVICDSGVLIAVLPLMISVPIHLRLQSIRLQVSKRVSIECWRKWSSWGSSTAPLPRTRRELIEALPPVYPHDLRDEIRRDVAALGRMLVVLDDDPTGTQTVHSVPVLADWSVDTLARELKLAGRYRVMYLNTNSRALPPQEASKQYTGIAASLKEACRLTGIEVSVVSRGDSTLRGHFPGDLIALEEGLGVRHDGWIVTPFFQAGGRITAGDVHFVEEREAHSATHDDGNTILVPAGKTEFARDAAFGYHSSNLVNWIREKAAKAAETEGGDVAPATARVSSVSLQHLRVGGPAEVGKILGKAGGGCIVVNAVEERDLEVLVKALLQEEIKGRRFLFRSAADLVAVRGAVDRRALLETQDFMALRAASGVTGTEGGLVVVGSYVAKTTQQLEHALAVTESTGVELRAAEVVGEGDTGRAAFDREVRRVRDEVSSLLADGRDVMLYTSRGIPVQGDGAGGLVFGERVGAALVACVAGISERPRFLVSKGGITSSDVATKALGMTRAQVMGQILPGVPVWSMSHGSRWPGLPLVVFPGNVGGKESLAEAMIKLGAKIKHLHLRFTDNSRHGTAPSEPTTRASSSGEVMYPFKAGSGLANRTLDILADARTRGAAVGAFTVYSLEGIRAVVEAAEATGRSAILQAHPAALGFQGGVPLLKAAVVATRICGEAGGPLLSVQLDHGTSEDHVAAALEAGVDSIMVDGSAMEYEDNIVWTTKMAAKAHKAGAAVEAELGKLAGEEDGMSVPEVEAKMTDPNQVADFLSRTRADVLAVTVGNVHGRYARPDPRLDLPRLGLIRDAAARVSPLNLVERSATQLTPQLRDRKGRIHGALLAMHGASGLPDSQVKASIALGVCKFNVNTEVRNAALDFLLTGDASVREQGKPSVKVDMLMLLNGASARMSSVIRRKMVEFDPR